MRGQSSPAGPCKYLHNNDKKNYVKFLQKKERKKISKFTEKHLCQDS